jgi:formylglycine-generating enzyme required for sulfatase activity
VIDAQPPPASSDAIRTPQQKTVPAGGETRAAAVSPEAPPSSIQSERDAQPPPTKPAEAPALPQRQDTPILPASPPALPRGLVVPVVSPAASDPCGGAVTDSFAARCAAPLTAAQERGLKPKNSFKECAQCPEMVVVPAGSFTMGSPESEAGHSPREGPHHTVTVERPFAVGKFHITIDQFAAFVAATGYDAGASCSSWDGSKFVQTQGRSWSEPGFAHAGSYPAVCLSWNDAKAYVDWLARTTGKGYRLLTEAEWEYAARGHIAPGAYPRYSFGDDEKDLCRYGNGADQTAKSTIPGTGSWAAAPCNDGYAYTSPVGSFAANSFGLYDMQGDAWQWTADCYHDSYNGAPTDGSAWTTGDCNRRLIRGGAWFDGQGDLRAAYRGRNFPDFRHIGIGFRVGRTLTR